jgi:hypothetical protein
MPPNDPISRIKEKRHSQADAKEKQALVDSLESVSSDVRELLASLETSGAKKLDKQVVEAISALSSIVGAIKQVRISNDSETKQALADIANILKGINLSPVINVPAPKVTVQERKIDFDPLINALNKEVPLDDDPLSGYKAQDINNDDPNIQYVGFINSTGEWYIIENNDSSLRYKFGKKNYLEAFKDCAKQSYKLYSEAVNEVKA